jgi:hypothetical protein
MAGIGKGGAEVRLVKSRLVLLGTTAAALGLVIAAGANAVPAHAATNGYYSVTQCTSYGACDTFYGDGDTLNEVVATVGEQSPMCQYKDGWGVWANGVQVASMPDQMMCGSEGGSSTDPTGQAYTFGIDETFASGTCITASPTGYYCLP